MCHCLHWGCPFFSFENAKIWVDAKQRKKRGWPNIRVEIMFSVVIPVPKMKIKKEICNSQNKKCEIQESVRESAEGN